MSIKIKTFNRALVHNKQADYQKGLYLESIL